MTHPYATAEYALCLDHVGQPVEVPEWGTWLLARPIPNGGGRLDLVGTYPVTVLDHEADVRAGLSRLRAAGFVSVCLVIEERQRPLLVDSLEVVRPFKTHYVFDPSHGKYAPPKHHAYEIRRASRRVLVRRVVLREHLTSWNALYRSLAGRHTFGETHRFSAASFARLAELSGVEAIGAFIEDDLVCCHIWVTHDGRAMSHLMASSDTGYAARAAYALNEGSVRLLGAGHVLDFGGGAGLADDDENGLARFKRGFANSTTTVYLAGCILDPAGYDQLVGSLPWPVNSTYFPPYRDPERGRR